jgi:hypothetical protein
MRGERKFGSFGRFLMARQNKMAIKPSICSGEEIVGSCEESGGV